MKKFKDVIKSQASNEVAVKRILASQHFWCDLFEGYLARFQTAEALRKFEILLVKYEAGADFYSAVGSDIYDSLIAHTGPDNAFNDKDVDSFEHCAVNFKKPPIRLEQVEALSEELKGADTRQQYNMIATFLRPHSEFPYLPV